MKPSATPFASSAPAGVTTTGLTVPISAKTGMTLSRSLARRHSAVPACCDPVKATAVICGACTRAVPASKPTTSSKVPSGAPARASASRAISPRRLLSRGCAGWALTTTGQPADSAAVVSLPSTPKAKGKLLAPKTATSPSGWLTRAKEAAPSRVTPR